jgi:hypothetical protein
MQSGPEAFFEAENTPMKICIHAALISRRSRIINLLGFSVRQNVFFLDGGVESPILAHAQKL